MKKGTIVALSPEVKKQLIKNGCRAHVKEFGHCLGVVEGPVDYGTSKGPEVDVRWLPSKLRYGYHPKELVIVHDQEIHSE